MDDAETDSPESAPNQTVDGVHSAALDGARPPRPAWAPLALGAFIFLVICTNIANATWVRFTNPSSPNPELLLLLSSRNRYLAFALGVDISIVAYATIGFARVMVSSFAHYFLGRAYGPEAIRVLKRYLGVTDEAEEVFNRGFAKAEWALIPLFVGSNIIGVLTGARRTPLGKLIALLSIGIAARLVLIWALARFFEDQLDSFLSFSARYQWWVLAGSIALVVLVNLKNFRRG